MLSHSYLRTLAGCALMWIGLFFMLIFAVDPYGVSPVRISIPGINSLKPKRVDIDRTIKPFEVWRYQPRTVFLGTSRIHQSINPETLDDTRFAPAYNASIPASNLGMNASHLQQYKGLDRALRTAFFELFLYNFLGQGQDSAPKGRVDVIRDVSALFCTTDAIWDSIATVWHNAMVRRPTYEIKPGGYFYYPPGHDAKGTFAGFPAGIWDLHAKAGGSLKLHEPAFSSFEQLVTISQLHDLEAIFLVTPNHAYVDYLSLIHI